MFAAIPRELAAILVRVSSAHSAVDAIAIVDAVAIGVGVQIADAAATVVDVDVLSRAEAAAEARQVMAGINVAIKVVGTAMGMGTHLRAGRN